MSQKGGWTASKRMKRENAAAAAAAGAAAGVAAASGSSQGGRRRARGPLRIFRRPKSVRTLNWGKGPFPENLWTVVTYSDKFQLTCTAGALQSYTFRLNSLFDPNLTGTGSQPRYFDTLCGGNDTSAPYRAYVVKAAKMKLLAWPTSPDSTGVTSAIGLTICPSATTGPTTVEELMMRSDTNYRTVSYYGGSRAITSVYRSADIADVLGVKDIEDANGTEALFNANPTNQAYGIVSVAPLNGSTAAVIQCNVEISFYVKFYSLNDVTDS